ncbi:MAG: OmpA family protein [Planctomycetes bacterium]|nr:OmpA family protein [Planctomycetota bacterium]
MKLQVLLAGGLLGVSMWSLGGCVSKAEFDKCVRRNGIQQERIEALEAAQETEKLRADKILQEFDLYRKQSGLSQLKIEALQSALAAKNADIERLLNQVGQIALPAELSSALSEWAEKDGGGLVSYDESKGIVRFKSDLLFDKGDDRVQTAFLGQLEELSRILSMEAANGFDVLIVGHTDDLPILRPGTLAKHPTNWHLSAHRAISVQKVFADAKLPSARLAVMGFGEHRPLEPNKPNQKGNPVNRRVEIYIIPSGQIRTVSAQPVTGS